MSELPGMWEDADFIGGWASTQGERDHEHTPGQIKWNGGNCVYLCADCERIVWHAVYVGTLDGVREWVPGERYGL